jgi:ribosomal protein L29
MNHEPKAMKASLLKRELELQRLIRQMKFDQLHNSSVYKNLEQELATVKTQLSVQQPQKA